MIAYWSALCLALWLGILTSISPCPLATNIAAISYIGRRVGNTKWILLSGLLYAFGRALVYIIVGIIVTQSLLSIPKVSNFLQHYMNLILGPLILVTGVILMDVIRLNISGAGISSSLQSRIEKTGLWGSLLLGMLFALTFCPVSAALFFGSLIPLALKHQSQVAMPLLYGLGTAVPVIAFAITLTISVRMVGALFNKITRIELLARRITGAIFILIGIYLIITNNFGMYLWA